MNENDYEIGEDLEVEDLEVNQDEEVDTTDWKAEAEKYKGIAARYKKQAAKAKEQPKQETKTETNDLSAKDMYAFMQAGVKQDDIDDVLSASKVLGVSPVEALNNSVVKTLLRDKEEKRQTALATNTGKERGGEDVISSDVLLDKASRGELPESEADMRKLAEARIERMKQANKH